MNWFHFRRVWALSSVVALSLLAGAPAEDKGPAASEVATTHEQLATIPLKGEGGITLQSLCVNSKGQIVALVAPPKNYGAPQKNAVSVIEVLTAEGKAVTTWKVNFHANSINVGPDDAVYVAGDGKVARCFGRDGKRQALVELPHIAKLLEDKEGMRKKAEQQVKDQKEQFARMIKTYEDMLKKLEDKKAEDRTKLEERQIEQYKQIMKSFDQTKKYYDELKVDDVIAQITGRLRIINSVAISEKDLFIVCGESQGYGFAVWRMDHQFGNPKQILKNVIGCCGQMDVQCCGSDILVAENTKHRFAKYDRDGKELGAWGKTGKETDPGCFSGCCNPMNIRCGTTGDIFTAESEGIIKRFSAKGDPMGIVASTKLTGGCKCVSLSAAPEGDRFYLTDIPNSRIVVFGVKPAKKAE